MFHTMMHLHSPRVFLLVQLKVNILTGAVYSLTALFGKTLEKLGFSVTFLQI